MSNNGGKVETVTAQREPAIRRELSVIDVHMHLWDKGGYNYDQKGHNYFAREYADEVRMSGHKVESSVHVECGMNYNSEGRPELRSVGETAFVAEQASSLGEEDPEVAKGIMGYADLMLGAEVRPVLEAHIEAGRGRFRGIRFRVACDPDPLVAYQDAGYPTRNILDETAIVQGAKCLTDMGLVMSVWAFHTQLEEFAKFAAKCPDLKMAVNHCGGPLGVGDYFGSGDQVFQTWSRGVDEIAKRPNVQIQIGGLGTSRMRFRRELGFRKTSSDQIARAWRPYISKCLEAFGPERTMFGSNFPVDSAIASYGVYLNAFKKMLSDYTSDELEAIFSGNAKRFYSLG